ncbi:MAG: hypothetical protein AAFZ17_17885, partial [Cyanobacteria bacterium J06650_10]
MTITRQFGRHLLSAAVVGVLGVACSNGLKDYTQVELRVLPTEVVASSVVAADSAESAQDEPDADIAKDSIEQDGIEHDGTKQDNTDTAEEKEDNSVEEGSETSSSETSSEETDSEDLDAAIAQRLSQVEAAVEKRLLSLGLETSDVSAEAPDQLIVRLPQGVFAETVVENITKPNRLTLRSQKADTEDELATNIEALQRLLVEQNNLTQTNNLAEAETLQSQIDETRGAILNLFEPSNLTGEMLLDAQAVQMSGFNIWEVQIWFDSQGTEKFAQQTKALAGTGRSLGIFLDDVLLSTPTVAVVYVDEGITGG